MVTNDAAPRRFRLYGALTLPTAEFEAATPAELMTAAHEARAQLRQQSWVVLQVWSETAATWCDPRYQNEWRRFEVRDGAVRYLRLWEDVWRWCDDALRMAKAGVL